MAGGEPIEAVLFDIVGTLIAPRQPVGATYAEVAARHGVDVSAKQVEAAFRSEFPAMPPMAFPDRAADAVVACERAWWSELVARTFARVAPAGGFEDFGGFFDDLFARFARPETWRLRPGAREALAALARADRRLAVVSNFDHRLHAVLDGLELRALFEFVLLPAEVGAAKPAPRIFACALERLGLPGSRVVLVGDDPHDDLAGAQRAGIRAIDVRELATLADLEAVLQRLEDSGDR